MKTQIMKIIITAVTLLFVSVGVSFAHDGNRKHHKHRGNDHGHYKNGYDDHHGWHNKHHNPPRRIYRHYKKWHGHHNRWHKKHYKRWHHYSDGHHYRWHKKHYKRWHHLRDRHHYRKGHRVHHHHYHSYDHGTPYEGTSIGFKLKEPGFKFSVVVNGPK